MSAIAPAEACPVARTCPKCGKELPQGAERCDSCWRWRFETWKWVLGAAGAVIVFLSTRVVPAVHDIFAQQSRTTVKIVGSPKNEPALLAIRVENSGKEPSDIHSKFTLRLEDSELEKAGLLQFGDLTLVSPDEQRRIPPGKVNAVILKFDITGINPAFDVNEQRFWAEYGDKKVAIHGVVDESNGKNKPVSDSVPLTDVKSFIKARSDIPEGR